GLGHLKLFFGALAAELREFETECGVGLVEGLLRHGVHGGQILSHAYRLRALPRKEERDGAMCVCHECSVSAKGDSKRKGGYASVRGPEKSLKLIEGRRTCKILTMGSSTVDALFPIFVRQGRSRTRYKVGYIDHSGSIKIE